MAYMAKQFLKRSMRLPGNTPIQALVTDNRDVDNLEFIMTLKRVDVHYECESCGNNQVLKGTDSVFLCENCYEGESIVKTLIEGYRYQEVEFNQAEAESLLEGLLFKIAKNINPETKVKLMGLLSASKET